MKGNSPNYVGLLIVHLISEVVIQKAIELSYVKVG